jgi:heterodisulfide reductase subunit D
MGLRRDDRYKHLKMMQDADAIMADCGDLITRHGLNPEVARSVIVKGMLADQPLPLADAPGAS